MYTAKVIIFPFNKTYKCKGHVLLSDINSVMLILENEKRVFVPNKYIIEFNEDWFKMELKNTKKDSLNQADVIHGANI